MSNTNNLGEQSNPQPLGPSALASLLNMNVSSQGNNVPPAQYNELMGALLAALSKGEATSIKIGNQTISINVSKENKSPSPPDASVSQSQSEIIPETLTEQIPAESEDKIEKICENSNDSQALEKGDESNIQNQELIEVPPHQEKENNKQESLSITQSDQNEEKENNPNLSNTPHQENSNSMTIQESFQKEEEHTCNTEKSFQHQEEELSLNADTHLEQDSTVDADEEKDKIDPSSLLSELIKIEGSNTKDPLYSKMRRFVNHLQEKERSLEKREKKIEVY